MYVPPWPNLSVPAEMLTDDEELFSDELDFTAHDAVVKAPKLISFAVS